MSERTLRIAAALIVRADGHVLLVRKRGTTTYIQPGGKIAADESAKDALLRELAEELGMRPDPSDLAYLGTCEDNAVHEPGWRVRAEVFSAPYPSHVVPAAEIAEARWVDPANLGDLSIAPLTRDRIFVELLPYAIKGHPPAEPSAR